MSTQDVIIRRLRIHLDREAAQRRLVEKARAGEKRAFNALYRQYAPVVYSLARHMVRDDEAAADVTQEAFVRAWRALDSLNDPQAFGGWIRMITLNQVRDWARAQRPTGSLDADSADQVPRQWADESIGPAEQLEISEQQQQVRDAIARLGEDQQVVVVMHHLEGKPVADISRELGIPLGTVLSRLARGREALRRKLAPHVED